MRLPPQPPSTFAAGPTLTFVAWCLVACGAPAVSAGAEWSPQAAQLLERFCFDCHGKHDPQAELDLEKVSAEADFALRFRSWRGVVQMLSTQRMPPADAEQPSDKQRQWLASVVSGELQRAAARHAADPGPVTLRRLTSAEYAYTIEDLTGLDLDLADELPGDAVGGEGFTNVGDVQFVQDATLERYLTTAKRVANHAVIGAGPLHFFRHSGETGGELSAIDRIVQIYRSHGFRTAAGEGGEPYGLDRYPQAFFVAWQFQHRDRLGLAGRTLAELAGRNHVDARFAEYIWRLLTTQPRAFPTSEIVAAWQALPQPDDEIARGGAEQPRFQSDVRARCDALGKLLLSWQDRLGQNPDAKEEARLLSPDGFRVTRRQSFEMNVNWPPGTEAAHLTFSVQSADGQDPSDAVVVWRSASLQFRKPDRVLLPPQPLAKFLRADDAKQLMIGVHPAGGELAAGDFATVGVKPARIELPIPAGATSARLLVDAELHAVKADLVLRCTIDQKEDTDQGKSVSGLLADPQNRKVRSWQAGVQEFARLLPQISQREPAPSDRDPIPPPFDGTYNQPERNLFHTRIKYHRDDAFLYDNMLDDAARRRLDVAWHDLLASCDYHDAWLAFVADKYDLNLGGRGIAELDEAAIARLPAEARRYVGPLHRSYHAAHHAQHAAQPSHLKDVLTFASRAWRRPLAEAEQLRLREYYRQLREDSQLDHRRALRTLLARVLTSADFLYRSEPRQASREYGEPVAPTGYAAVPLSDWELASRLSYFLWSSLPDDELRRVAAAGELTSDEQLAYQVRRMLRDPKARRLATEFFGQWLGFYRFDNYRGVDPQRFPEFTDELKRALYDEAVSFFEHIVREDRPIGEVLFADYTFVNRMLAEHYGLSLEVSSNTAAQRVEGLRDKHRGGLFGLGAVLTATSAPLRTSPVKRGDWILRRVLGTPVPPPPADAGSIPADDLAADGHSVRQRLEAHRREASCRNCHARIDPLGFTLEHFDSLGRWRESYRDGLPIEDSGQLADGAQISGPQGLRDYLARHEQTFARNLCTRLAGYALGRGESIADAALIDQMVADAANGRRFAGLVERIVLSRQFRYRRGEVAAAAVPGDK